MNSFTRIFNNIRDNFYSGPFILMISNLLLVQLMHN